MRNSIKVAVFLFGVLAVSACSSITTSADYDRAVDFSKYKTYAWKDVDATQNALLENRIKSAVDSALAAKGLQKVSDNPDLWVVAHPRLTKETQINTYNTGWGYGWGWRGGYGGGTTTSTVSEIPVGNLVVDLVDANKKQLVWRGTASKTIDPSSTPEQKQKNVDEAVTKMFEPYPPKPAA
jgi:uncharacterized protein DUF4136